jgi:hypothetical protein
MVGSVTAMTSMLKPDADVDDDSGDSGDSDTTRDPTIHELCQLMERNAELQRETISAVIRASELEHQQRTSELEHQLESISAGMTSEHEPQRESISAGIRTSELEHVATLELELRKLKRVRRRSNSLNLVD